MKLPTFFGGGAGGGVSVKWVDSGDRGWHNQVYSCLLYWQSKYQCFRSPPQ